METNKKSVVDLSDYFDSKKKEIIAGALPKPKKTNMNKIHLVAIVVFVLIIAAFWSSHMMSQNAESAKASLAPAPEQR